jgi:predicted nucleotidyltransferase
MTMQTLAELVEKHCNFGAIARLASEQHVDIDILVVPHEDRVDVILSTGDTLEQKIRKGATELERIVYEA